MSVVARHPRGSAFSIELPLADEPRDPPPAPAAAQARAR